MTIDLTPEELREFAKLWVSDATTVPETTSQKVKEFVLEIDKDVLGSMSNLALALADAMEERDKLRAELEAARERVVEAKLEGKIEALDDLWKPVRRDQTGKTVECTWADGVTPQYVYAEIDRIAREIANLPKPAVRAARGGGK